MKFWCCNLPFITTFIRASTSDLCPSSSYTLIYSSPSIPSLLPSLTSLYTLFRLNSSTLRHDARLEFASRDLEGWRQAFTRRCYFLDLFSDIRFFQLFSQDSCTLFLDCTCMRDLAEVETGFWLRASLCIDGNGSLRSTLIGIISEGRDSFVGLWYVVHYVLENCATYRSLFASHKIFYFLNRYCLLFALIGM